MPCRDVAWDVLCPWQPMQVIGLSQLWPAQHPVWLGYNMQELSLATPGLAGCNQALSSLFLFFQASKKLVAATGQQCLPLSVDVRQPQTIAAAVDEALKEFKRIDILINGEDGQGRGGFGLTAHWAGCFPAQAALRAQRKQRSVCGTWPLFV